MIKKLTNGVGNFTHAEIRKLYENGTIDVEMIIISEQTDQDTDEKIEVEQYREKGTSFCPPYPFELTLEDIELLRPKRPEPTAFMMAE